MPSDGAIVLPLKRDEKLWREKRLIEKKEAQERVVGKKSSGI